MKKTEIKFVYHCADLHIRLYKRHDEYREQFVKFFTSVKEHMSNNNLKREEVRIVIAGDIVHSKNQMTPELIDIVTWLFNKCCDICETVVILGNHDFLANNMDRMDALSPIISTLNNPELKFLKHTGCYEDNNVVWCVYGHMEGSKRPEIEESKQKYGDDKIYIGLYHDPLVGLKTNIGFEFEDGQDISIFEGCDMVMCGDIHYRQVLNYHGTPIVQVGSLIQQDFGESPKDHGYLVWDVGSRTYEGFDLPTEYGFYTFKIDSIDVIENDGEVLMYM
jgi:DNA repair exonuclease SbcCD nuclease subunit